MVKQRMKQAVRPLVRPLLQRLDARFDRLHAHATAHLLDKLRALEQSIADANRRTDENDRVVPALLDAVSVQNAAARQIKRAEASVWRSIEAAERRLAHVEQRLEQVRRELLFELRYGGHERGVIDPAAEPKIVNEEKVAAQRGALRLNLGCGAFPMDEYVNVDIRELNGVDVVADLRNLPFEEGEVAEVFSSHVLEHFPEEELSRRLLPYWVSLLKPGGVFRAIVPDSETMMREWAAGRYDFEDLRIATYGDQEYEGDFHFAMYTPASLAARFEQAGLRDVEVVECGRRNGICYEMELTGRRPERPPQA